MMRISAVTILLVICMACSLAGAADDPLKLIGDRNQWSAFAWDKLERSRLFAAIPWTKTGMPQFKAFRYSHRTRLNDVPVLFEAMKSSPDNNEFGDFEISYSTFDKRESEASLNRLLGWCIGNYGDKYRKIDNVRRNYQTQSLDLSYVYWEIGNTLVRFVRCAVVDKGVMVYIGRISYLDARYFKVKSPDLLLSCELDVSNLDRGIADMLPEKLEYKIEESDRLIKSMNDDVVAENIELSDSLIKFTKETETMAKVTVIDRVTGAYSYQLFSRNNTARVTPDIVISGRCRRIGEIAGKGL